MDILRKELDAIYRSQGLADETLRAEEVVAACGRAELLAAVTDGCAVVTDAAADRCYVYSGNFGRLMGFAFASPEFFEADSSDEDVIYARIHPEDLVDKRLLEYEFFKIVDGIDSAEKTMKTAVCRLRMKDGSGVYRAVDNTTQLITLSPAGKIWLILCTYRLAGDEAASGGINPRVIDTRSGEVRGYSFAGRHSEILSPREKEVLMLIREGLASKQIADRLKISINTVNRHRQNILEKLSVANSAEAVAAATLMRLL